MIVLACQTISRYVLGFQTFTADFISGGVIGLILGTIFRFLAYRFFVFNEELDEDPAFSHDHETFGPSPASEPQPPIPAERGR